MTRRGLHAFFLASALLTPAYADKPARAPLLQERTVAQLQADQASGSLTAEGLTSFYLARIAALDQGGPGVNAVIELNPDALAEARRADRLRRSGRVLGPLHGIPVLLKDNIDTGDRMQTSAGSFGLVGRPAAQDSTVAANLRAGGAVILGKTNLSEWANFRSFGSISGWSGRGGQTHNPYGIDRNPCGSSAGSAAAASAGFAAVTIGTETDGSIVCPSSVNGVVGLKPTVGLTSRAGVVPISHTQDSVGPHGRTVADVAAALSVLQSRTYDGRDPATGSVPLGWTGRSRPTGLPTDYTRFLSADGLRGARIGVTHVGIETVPPLAFAAFEAAVAAIEAAGATVIDLDAAGVQLPYSAGEFLVLVYEFRQDLQAYLATRRGVPLAGKTLADAIVFNEANADREMPFFGQEVFELAQSLEPGQNDPQPAFDGLTYRQALELGRQSGAESFDKVLADNGLDAIVDFTAPPAWSTDLVYGDRLTYGSSGLVAPAGYPLVNVPAGMVLGLPVGITFFGTAFSEPTLIRLASGFEAVTNVRRDNPPTFAATMPDFSIQGTRLRFPGIDKKRGVTKRLDARRPRHW